jgi:predicted DNA-binding transcriptional regulator YafY
MPRSENQKLKLFYLRQILLEKTDHEHGITVPQIIEALSGYGINAERKTVYSDISLLNETGLTITSKKTQNGTFYYVEKREFELAELKLLVDAIQSSKFVSKTKSNELIKKLEKYCSGYEASRLQRQVYVLGRIKTMNESVYKTIDVIHTAIGNNRKINFRYGFWNIKKEMELKKSGELYNISPWALAWSNENYYMIGFDSAAGIIKHYRVDKMADISLDEEKREGEAFFKSFNLADYTRKNISMYEGEDRTVTLEIDNGKIGIFIDRFGRDEITVLPQSQNRSIVRFEVNLNPQFIGWIFSLGDKVKIIGPESAVRKTKELLSEMNNLYL